jgi:hypothetical protein
VGRVRTTKGKLNADSRWSRLRRCRALCILLNSFVPTAMPQRDASRLGSRPRIEMPLVRW